MPMKTRRDMGTRPYTPDRAGTRKAVLRAVAELESRGEHVNGEAVARLTGMRESTAGRYLAGLRAKGLAPRITRRPPELCNYTTRQAPESEIEARLKILAARTKELDRRPTFDEICQWLPK